MHTSKLALVKHIPIGADGVAMTTVLHYEGRVDTTPLVV
jgi:hypothetical protein